MRQLFGDRPKIIVINSYNLERDLREKAVPTFSRPALRGLFIGGALAILLANPLSMAFPPPFRSPESSMASILSGLPRLFGSEHRAKISESALGNW